MGCDIHSHAERKNPNGEWEIVSLIDPPFNWRSYGVFAFLAGVRNYSAVTPIAPPRGLPEDISNSVKADYDSWNSDAHTPSWLTVKELSDFDYDQRMEDRRCMRGNDGGCTCDPGEGILTTYREFFGDGFLLEIQRLGAVGAERIVFWFDN